MIKKINGLIIMKKLVFLLALVAFQCSFALTLTIGTAPQNPPFGDIADQQGNFFGFDIDIDIFILVLI